MKLDSMISEEAAISGVNIVPVIDLCLVLLIILMVTSPLLETSELPVKLPQALTIETKERNISVTSTTDGRLAINTESVADAEFETKLAYKLKEDPEIMVILRVDKTAAYGTLTHLWERCKNAGAKRIAIGTEQRKVNG